MADLQKVVERIWYVKKIALLTVIPAKLIEIIGDVNTVVVAGQRLIILNSAEAAFDLLEKRSSIYSSRPKLLFGGEL